MRRLHGLDLPTRKPQALQLRTLADVTRTIGLRPRSPELSEQNEQLKAEIVRLRAFGAAEASRGRTEIEQQMEDVKVALQSLLDQPTARAAFIGAGPL